MSSNIYAHYIYIVYKTWAIKSKFPYVLFILGPCSHCYLSQGATDGPCKVSEKYNPRNCINQAETLYCSTIESEFKLCEIQGITK